MTKNLGEYVIHGEVFNRDRHSTHGWLQLRGREQSVLFELFGDPAEDLRGKRIQFEAGPVQYSFFKHREIAEGKKSITDRHVGAVATMTASEWVRVFDGPAAEFLARSRLGEPPPVEWKRTLRLSWFSQDGFVSIQLIDPGIWVIDDSGKGDDDDDGVELPPPDDPPPYDPAHPPPLAPHELQLYGQAADVEPRSTPPGSDTDDIFLPDLDLTLSGMGWEGPTPGQDEHIAELELMDDIIERGGGMPLGEVLCKLPEPDSLSEERAAHILKLLVARLARFNIGFHTCNHLSMKEAYRILVREIAGVGTIHPELVGTGWFTHYDASEFCPDCEREIMEDYGDYVP